MTPPLPLDEAQARLLALAAPLGGERVPIGKCSGRFLRSDLKALRTQPAADLSAMDGYAVHDADGSTWRIVGESAAGRPFAGTLGPGEAVRISTGALMPDGATAVLLQEDAVREHAWLTATSGEVPSSRHIRRRGFDFTVGDTVLEAGTRLGPAQLALAVTAGHGAGPLELGRRPKVAVIESGDELATGATSWDWQEFPDHKLPASNGAMIAAMAAPHAKFVFRIGPVPDDSGLLVRALVNSGQTDVVVVTGGASVGDHDLVRPALEAWGATIEFWRVAMKPGKPILFARRGEQWVLGLPGNPVSSYVTAFLFLLPLLRRLGGAAECLPRALTARLDRALPAGGPRLELIRARLASGVATPIDEQDSSALRALAAADALIVRPIGASPAAAGDEVAVFPLENGGTA